MTCHILHHSPPATPFLPATCIHTLPTRTPFLQQAARWRPARRHRAACQSRRRASYDWAERHEGNPKAQATRSAQIAPHCRRRGRGCQAARLAPG
eukprot:351075-Chlamydomonas_euryale.AAC.5